MYSRIAIAAAGINEPRLFICQRICLTCQRKRETETHCVVPHARATTSAKSKTGRPIRLITFCVTQMCSHLPSTPVFKRSELRCTTILYTTRQHDDPGGFLWPCRCQNVIKIQACRTQFMCIDASVPLLCAAHFRRTESSESAEKCSLYL